MNFEPETLCFSGAGQCGARWRWWWLWSPSWLSRASLQPPGGTQSLPGTGRCWTASTLRQTSRDTSWSELGRCRTVSPSPVLLTVLSLRLKNSPIHYISLPALPAPAYSYSSGRHGGDTGLSDWAQHNTEKLTQQTKKLTAVNLAELPKTGAGVLLYGKYREKFTNKNFPLSWLRNPSKYSSPHSLSQNSKILKPKIMMKINGKPYNPYTIKNQFEKYKKKKKKERLKIKSNEIIPDIEFSANGKPSNVYNLTESQPGGQHSQNLMPFDLRNKKQNHLKVDSAK